MIKWKVSSMSIKEEEKKVSVKIFKGFKDERLLPVRASTDPIKVNRFGTSRGRREEHLRVDRWQKQKCLWNRDDWRGGLIVRKHCLGQRLNFIHVLPLFF